MSRRARSAILFDGCFAHILSRSFDRQRIYEDAEDFESFKALLLKAKRKFDFLIHHYCLMHTHFHLLVSISKVERFSQALQWLKREYTVCYNQRRKRTGPLWRERFKSLVIEDETYLHACGLYVEENPMRAGLVEKKEDWPHSSAACYVLGLEDPLMDSYQFEGTIEKLPATTGEMFMKGPAIGSELFLLHIKEGIFNKLSVP